jgi:hypothetical protein
MQGRAAIRRIATRPIVLEGGFDEGVTFFYIPFKGRVLFHTTYSEELQTNAPRWSRTCICSTHSTFSSNSPDEAVPASSGSSLCELHSTIPPKRLQLIRRYGLYASRTKGWWEEMPWVAERAPEGWKTAHQLNGVAHDRGYEPLSRIPTS